VELRWCLNRRSFVGRSSFVASQQKNLALERSGALPNFCSRVFVSEAARTSIREIVA
jgi:hypothetical protein